MTLILFLLTNLVLLKLNEYKIIYLLPLNTETMTGLAFINLAQAVVTVVNRRNKEQAPTNIVKVKR